MLLVLQGKPTEERAWAIPGGGAVRGESLEACCRREVREETGYQVAVGREVSVKWESPVLPNERFELHIFHVTVVGGASTLNDPDRLIRQVGWSDFAEVQQLRFAFPEDKALVLQQLQESS